MKIIIHYTTRTVVIAGAVLVLVIAVGISLARQSPTPIPIATQPSVALTPSSVQEGDIQVDVARDPSSTATAQQFTLTLNTHSGDLSTFDAQTNVVYRTEKGQEVFPQSVGGDKETHHRTITVAFANIALPGTIVIKNLRGVPERTFPVK